MSGEMRALRFLNDLQAWLKPRRVSLIAVKAAGDGVTRVLARGRSCLGGEPNV